MSSANPSFDDNDNDNVALFLFLDNEEGHRAESGDEGEGETPRAGSTAHSSNKGGSTWRSDDEKRNAHAAQDGGETTDTRRTAHSSDDGVLS